MSPAATPSSSSSLMTENEPAQTHDDHEQRDVRSSFTTRSNARGACIVRWSTSRPARYFLRCSRACSRSSPSRPIVDLHAGPGHGADDSQHARRRTTERRRDRGGVAAGQAVWTVAASAGVVALLTASEPVFRALKLVGAAYLVYLGAQSLWAAVARRAHEHARAVRRAALAAPRAAAGGLSNLGNPKMAVFFASLLPQFAPEGSARSPSCSRSASCSAR